MEEENLLNFQNSICDYNCKKYADLDEKYEKCLSRNEHDKCLKEFKEREKCVSMQYWIFSNYIRDEFVIADYQKQKNTLWENRLKRRISQRSQTEVFNGESYTLYQIFSRLFEH